ncbi:MAG: ANTAR domain-containing protein, partial [Acidimicrobiales bacterium]
VYAEPLAHRGRVLGAVVAYRPVDRPLGGTDIEALRTLAQGAAIGVVQARTLARARRLAEQLQGALDSRVAIEQAKGVLAERLAVPVEDAFSLMRRHARNHRRRLDTVAREVVHGTMSATDLRAAS